VALLRKMTCNLRHPMGLRHPVFTANAIRCRRPIGCLKLQVVSHKRATNYRALLQKMTYGDKTSYGVSPPCKSILDPTKRNQTYNSFVPWHCVEIAEYLELHHTSSFWFLHVYIYYMYISIYTYTYIHICMCICIHRCIFVYTHTWIYIYIFLSLSLSLSVY